MPMRIALGQSTGAIASLLTIGFREVTDRSRSSSLPRLCGTTKSFRRLHEAVLKHKANTVSPICIPSTECDAVRALFLAAAISQIWISGAFAEGADTQVACAATAFKNYLTANQAFKSHRSVEDQIAQRRLQEQFCLRFVRCIALDKGQAAEVASGSDFADCLKEEATELYKLYKD